MSTAYFRHILVPVDGSDCSTAAVEFALRLAGPAGHVTFANAIDIGAAIDESVTPFGGNPALVLNALEAERHADYTAADARARAAGIPSDRIDLRGPAIGAILGAIPLIGADAIVMGTHGRHGIARAVLGSVAEGVLRRAGVPTFVVHAHGVSAPAPEALVRRIVVGVDALARPTAAVALAVDLAAAYGARLFFVHAGDEADDDSDEGRLLGATLLAESRGVQYDTVLGDGKPSEAILSAATVVNADLIAIGVHGHGSLVRFIRGSVSANVVQASRIPVVIAHEERGARHASERMLAS